MIQICIYIAAYFSGVLLPSDLDRDHLCGWDCRTVCSFELQREIGTILYSTAQLEGTGNGLMGDSELYWNRA